MLGIVLLVLLTSHDLPWPPGGSRQHKASNVHLPTDDLDLSVSLVPCLCNGSISPFPVTGAGQEKEDGMTTD